MSENLTGDVGLMREERRFLERQRSKHEAAMRKVLGAERYAAIMSRGGSYVGSEAARINKAAPFTNEMRSRLECLRLWLDTPNRFLAYVGCGGFSGCIVCVKTWVGDRIADASEGRHYVQRGFNGAKLTRVPIRVEMGGRVYVGTWTQEAGEYVKLRATKDRP